MRSQTWALAAIGVALGLSAPPVAAQEPATAAKVEKLKLAYQEAYDAWMKSYRDSAARLSKQARTELMARRPRPTAWFEKFWAVVEQDPKSDAAGEAAQWLVRQRAFNSQNLGKVIAVVQRHHIGRPGMGSMCGSLQFSLNREVEPLLRAVARRGAEPMDRALATYTLAKHIQRQASFCRRLPGAEAGYLEAMSQAYGKEAVDVLRSADAAALDKEAEQLLADLVADEELGGVRYRRGTIASTAKTDLFEVRNLGIGKVAPEIVGEDIDGKAMKLSDYRGKVVVLDFWGDW